MKRNENESITFHNENFLLQVALWIKVVGWVILTIYLLSTVNEVMQIIASGGFQLPPATMDKLMYFANFLYPVVMGAFYFLLTQGVAQGLYIGLDMLLLGTESEE